MIPAFLGNNKLLREITLYNNNLPSSMKPEPSGNTEIYYTFWKHWLEFKQAQERTWN
jgi:hypothetical protein